MGWAGSVPGHGEQEGLGERAWFVRITERSSVYQEHVRRKVVRGEAGKANRNLNLNPGTPVKGFESYPGGIGKSLKDSKRE